MVEVALGVHFTRPAQLAAPHLGLFWRQVQRRFPNVEQEAPIPATIETERSSPVAGVMFQVGGGPLLPRTLFIDSEGSQMLQVQSDFLVHNWRKAESEQAPDYPRYPAIRRAFLRDLAAFERFIADAKLGSLVVQQVEISYINHIARAGVWDTHADVDKVLRVFSTYRVDGGNMRTEDVQLHTRSVLRDANGRFLGRLHVNFQPAFKLPAMEPIFVLTLTARGAPLGDRSQGITDFLDLGREAIVRGFADLTTEAMHTVWQRRR